MRSLKEWHKKTSKALDLLPKVEKSIRSIAPNADIILYGSRVRGEASSDSDWDFLILVDQNLDNKLALRIKNNLYDVELETDEILSSIIRTKEEWNSPKYSILPIKRNIEREGILL